jgi:hypothetical protein
MAQRTGACTQFMDMDTTCFDTTAGVRTILRMSPAVTAAAIVSAQKCGLNLCEWLDRAVANLIADDHPEGAAPWSVHSADLFAQVVNCSPELLHGRWAVLAELVRLDRSLCHEPTQTVGDMEDGEPLCEPYIVAARLRKAWPRLVTPAFCL